MVQPEYVALLLGELVGNDGFHAGQTLAVFVGLVRVRLGALGVKNMEMEASLLFSLATLRGLRAGAVCAIYANRGADTFVDTDLKDAAEAACIGVGLKAFEVLRQMDAARGEAPHWRPGLGL